MTRPGAWRLLRQLVATLLQAIIPQTDPRSLDPIWTTAYVTRNFGYLVFDTLFAVAPLAFLWNVEKK